ncbi:MAG: CBS domain-containing protein [Erysipelotrichaceae bacterium]|nr:CBS domain-containing protein [Erysipelotrichaceae bacterium]
MEKKNVLFLLTPKAHVACLSENMNGRQALEKMRAHGFTALPLLSENGEYLGTISEGDLLWFIVKENGISMEDLEKVKIRELISKEVPAVKVDADVSELVSQIMNHNFIPVVDDRHVFMGIVTRRRVIQELSEQ